ncbi:hypothetical protein SCP_1001140 [Sparassis crispa]|uniref:Golgi pH regulator n=1 Tax=Sparassis crispa TaxID=139825 RepID=A0A401GXF8_9APHY|nr:hypothetical protein SCP_1001140 [Sparassis crispa]GBE86872.1 hypothetical protein SCP_1001140 [Sparassis crispa]
MSTASPGLETCILVFIKILLFFACRGYLLRNLYHDLQDLSAQQTVEPGSPPCSDDANLELTTLPGPSTAVVAVASGRPLHSTLSRSLFSLCFSEICTLFLLLMCQGIDLLDPGVRLINWKVSLWLLLATILVFIPLSYSLVLSGGPSGKGTQPRQRPSVLRALLNILSVGLFLFLLSFIPLPSSLPTSDFMGTTLSRLTVLGTIILGALSGFGAVNTAWNFFPPFYGTLRSHPTEGDIAAAEQGLQRVRRELAQRQSDIQKLQAAQQPNQEASWFSHVVPFRGDSQMSSAMQEMSGLESLEYQMSRNLEALRQRQADANFSRTISGKLFNWGGRIFAIYCVYRILNAIVNLIIPRTAAIPSSPKEPVSTSVDMMSTAIAHLLSLLPSVEISTKDIALISRQISLGLVGVIILSSIRLVLRGVARALRVTSRNLGASLMLLMLAQLMGIYLLSTLIQLRTSFPPPPARPDTEVDQGTVNLFSTLPEYQLFGSLFDGSFLLAAGVSGVGRWFGDRINGVGAD